MGLPEYPGVNAQAQHLAAFGRELIECAADDFGIAPAIHFPHGEQLRIVPLGLVRNRHQRRISPHEVGLVVVRPVEDKVEPCLCQSLRRSLAFAVVLTRPTTRLLSKRVFERTQAIDDELAFLFLAHVRGDHSVQRPAVRDEFVSRLLTTLDQIGKSRGGQRIGADCGPKAVMLENVEHAKDPDPVAKLAPRVVLKVRIVGAQRTGEARIGNRVLGRIEFHLFEV